MIEQERYDLFKRQLEGGLYSKDRMRNVLESKGYNFDEYWEQYVLDKKAAFDDQQMQMYAANLPRATTPGPEPDPFVQNVAQAALGGAQQNAGYMMDMAASAPQLAGMVNQYMPAGLGYYLANGEQMPLPPVDPWQEKLKKKADEYKEAGLKRRSDALAQEVYAESFKNDPSAYIRSVITQAAGGLGEVADMVIPTKAFMGTMSKLHNAINFGHLTDDVTRGMGRAMSDMNPVQFRLMREIAEKNFSTQDLIVAPAEELLIRSSHSDWAVSDWLQRDNPVKNVARKEVEFMNAVARGEVPATPENIVKAGHVYDSIVNGNTRLIQHFKKANGEKYFKTLDPARDLGITADAYNEAHALRNILVKKLPKDIAAEDLRKAQKWLFRQGDEDLSGPAGFLKFGDKIVRDLWNHDIALIKLGAKYNDPQLEARVLLNRDLGTAMDHPTFRGTYLRGTGKDDILRGQSIPYTPQSLALNSHIIKRGKMDPEEVVYTGESLHHILSGRWEVDGMVGKFVPDTLTPEEVTDLSTLIFSRRVVTDLSVRKREQIAHKHYIGLLDEWIGEAEEGFRSAAELKILRRHRALAEEQYQHYKISMTKEARDKHAQIIKNLEDKYGDDIIRLNERAQRFNEFQVRQLDMAEEVGFLTREMKEKMIAENSFHAPFKILTDSFGDPYVRNASRSTSVRLKDKIRGKKQVSKENLSLQELRTGYSESYKYEDPIFESISRSQQVVAFYERQRVAQRVVDLFKAKKLGGKVQSPIPGADVHQKALAEYLDMFPDFHMERTNALPGGIQPENAIRYFNNGVTEYWKADKDIVDAVGMLVPDELGGMMKIAAGYAHMLRLGATSTPKFAIKNFLRDPLTQQYFTDEGGMVGWDSIVGMFHYLDRDDVWGMWERSGGGHSTQTTLDQFKGALPTANTETVRTGKTGKFHQGWERVRNEEGASRAKGAGQMLYSGLREMGQASETAARIGHMNRLRLMREAKNASWKDPKYWPSKILKYKNDVTVGFDKYLKAAMRDGHGAGKRAFNEYRQRDFDYISTLKAIRGGTIDFHELGRVARHVNRVKAFTNANLQDFKRLTDAFREKPFATTLRVNTTIIQPSLYFWNKNKDDPDYWREPAWRRNLFWAVAKTDDGFFWLPKPFLPGVLFGSMVENMAQFAYENDPEQTFAQNVAAFLGSDEGRQTVEAVIDNSPGALIGGAAMLDMWPGGDPPDLLKALTSSALPIVGWDVGSTAFQVASNRDVFKDRDIVPRQLEGGDVRTHKRSNSSESLVAAAEAGWPVDPMMGEFVIGEALGGLGKLGLSAADAITAKAQDKPKEEPTWQKLASGLSGIWEPKASGYGTEPARNVYQELNRLDYYAQTANNIKANGSETEEYIQYREDHKYELIAHKRLLAAHKVMSSKNTRKNKVMEDKSLSARQRVKKLKELDKEIENAAEKAMAAIERYKEKYLER